MQAHMHPSVATYAPLVHTHTHTTLHTLTHIAITPTHTPLQQYTHHLWTLTPTYKYLQISSLQLPQCLFTNIYKYHIYKYLQISPHCHTTYHTTIPIIGAPF